ncbi:MAG: hypothetical protein NZ455_01005 [Bacteroidia bacterium]|nr:hypothetical protein [Bacteroidia bacterium]MDW8346575.1 hypothetical protein [Bacteroidia bacterium]
MRSAAKHRSDSAARSTPTRAQRGTRPKNSKKSITLQHENTTQ